MEVPGGHKNKIWVYIFEAIGTSNLLSAINMCASFAGNQPFAISLTILANICIFGSVTGGHFNPAVTIGVLIAEGSAI